MFQLHVWSAPQLPWLLYLVNIAVASLLVCGLTLLVQRAWPHRTLPLRHTILLVGLLVTLAVPAIVGLIDAAGFSLIEISSPLSVAAVASAPGDPAAAALELPLELPHTRSNPDELTHDQQPGQGGPAPLPSPQASLGSADHAIERALDRSAEPVFSWRYLAWAGVVLLLVWCAGSLSEVYRFALGLIQVRRFLRTVEPVTDARLQRIARGAARSLGLKACPALGQSPAIETPVSGGLLRGQVVLPSRQLHEWSDDAWRALLLHEMAHVRRHDLLIGLVQRVAIMLYWWNPLLRRISAHIAVLREQICDDLVTQHGSQEDRYAALIVELAGRVVSNRPLGPVLGAADGTPSELAMRIRRLLDPNRQLATNLSRTMKCAIAAFCVALILGVSSTSIHWARAQENEPAKSAAKPTADKGTETIRDAPADSPVAPANATDAMLHRTVCIVNYEGHPIVGAVVTAWAIRTAQAHGIWTVKGFGRSEPPVLTTGADGCVSIAFPRYVDPGERIPPTGLSLRVEHPDYATNGFELNVDPASLALPQKFALMHGAQVEVHALIDGKPAPADGLFAMVSGPYSVGNATSAGKVQLPRMIEGVEELRVVYLPAEGQALFSDVHTLNLVDGKESELNVELHPGVTVKGRLDSSVPRPIKNGRVSVRNINRSVTGNSWLDWLDWAPIEEDGTFTLKSVPRGDLQVIALCDDFMAASGKPPKGTADLSAQSRPQVFSIGAAADEITLQMSPTANCTLRVLDSEGRPLAGAKSSFWPNVQWWNGGSQIYCNPLFSSAEHLKSGDPAWHWSEDDHSFTAVTDASGLARIANLPPGAQNFIVQHDDFEMPLINKSRNGEITLKVGDNTEVTVTLEKKGTRFLGDVSERKVPTVPAPTALVSAPASKPTVVTDAEPTELAGVVVDEKGQPLADVNVDAWTWHPGNETKTDKEGRFVLKGFERNEAVEIEFTKPDYSPALFIERMPGTSDWTVVLTQGTWLEGQVLDPQGMPVPKALIRAWRGPFRNPHVTISQVWTETHADEQGRYHLNLEPATYTIEVRIPGVGALRETNVTLAAKEKKSLDLKLDAGVTFEATVRDSITGQPVEGIVLWNWQHSDIKGKSDKEGKIVIEGMMPGEFKFQLSAIGSDRRQSAVAGEYARWWSPQAKNEWQRDETLKDKKVPPGFEGLKGKELDQLKRSLGIGQFQRNFDDLTFDLGGMSTQVEILVESTVTIAGRVLDPDGNPVAGVTVAPAKTGSGNSLTGDTRFSYPTDKEGRFTMKLPAGKEIPYNLIAHDGKYQQWRNWANAAGENLLTKPGEKIDGVELRLTRGGIVKGRVLSAAGQPRAHVEVRAAAVDKRDNRYYVPTTRTDENGNYELRFISPGEQHIQVEPFWLQADQAPKSSTQVVTIKPNAVLEGIDFKTD